MQPYFIKMKKNYIYLIIAGAFLIVCLIIVLFNNGVFQSSRKTPKSDIFAVKDTANITKIFIADANGEHVLLNRRDGAWYVQDSILAMPEKINSLLTTICNVTLQQTVAKTAQSNINRMMSVNAIKVEIYQKTPKFTLFGIKFFNKERKVKTYYMGPATMDNVSNFAILEGFDEPCIVNIPGFRGFLTPTYSFKPVEWYNCDLFSTKITRIKTLSVKDYINPNESYSIEKVGIRFFNLYNAQHQQIMDYDTVKLLDMLAEYRDKNYERYIDDLSKASKDSIFKFNLFKIITLTDVNGKKTELRMYRKMTPDMMYLDAIVGGSEHAADEPYNRDKFYAVLNGHYENLVQCQYFHFERQNQPLSYFLKQK